MTERCPTCQRPLRASRTTDPDTSSAAAEDVAHRNPPGPPKAYTQRGNLLHAFTQTALTILTDQQAAEIAGLNRPGVCWWKRCSELRQGGYLVHAGTTMGENGSLVNQWTLTEEGRRLAESLYPDVSMAEQSPVADNPRRRWRKS